MKEAAAEIWEKWPIPIASDHISFLCPVARLAVCVHLPLPASVKWDTVNPAVSGKSRGFSDEQGAPGIQQERTGAPQMDTPQEPLGSFLPSVYVWGGLRIQVGGRVFTFSLFHWLPVCPCSYDVPLSLDLHGKKKSLLDIHPVLVTVM